MTRKSNSHYPYWRKEDVDLMVAFLVQMQNTSLNNHVNLHGLYKNVWKEFSYLNKMLVTSSNLMKLFKVLQATISYLECRNSNGYTSLSKNKRKQLVYKVFRLSNIRDTVCQWTHARIKKDTIDSVKAALDSAQLVSYQILSTVQYGKILPEVQKVQLLAKTVQQNFNTLEYFSQFLSNLTRSERIKYCVERAQKALDQTKEIVIHNNNLIDNLLSAFTKVILMHKNNALTQQHDKNCNLKQFLLNVVKLNSDAINMIKIGVHTKCYERDTVFANEEKSRNIAQNVKYILQYASFFAINYLPYNIIKLCVSFI